MGRMLMIMAACLLAATPLTAQRGRCYKSLAEVTNADSVYRLDLSHKKLRSIPEQVLTMSNLRFLNLSYNRIDTLHEGLSNLKHLDTLNLGRNRLRNIPEWMGRMTSLTVLNLNRNPILELPASMAALTNLKHLILWSTGVVSFPPEFAALNYTLKEVDMRVCPMTYDDQEAVERILPSPRKRWDRVCNCK